MIPQMHIHRWVLSNPLNGATPGRCACGDTCVFTDEPAGPKGRLKRDAIKDDKAPHDLIVEPTR